MSNEKKDEPQVNETALIVEDSPPLTSSLFSRNSAASAEEQAYLRQASILKFVRFGLSVFNFCISVVVVGCSGHVLFSYNQSHKALDAYLMLWPFNVDVKPTVGILVPSIIVAITNLAYVLFAIIPSPHSRTLYQVLLFLFSSSISIFATLFAVLFKQILLYVVDSDSRETLQTWTCKFYYGAKNFQSEAYASNINLTGKQLVPAGFERLCMENMTGQWMTVVLFVVQIVCFGVAMWGFVAERKIKKSRDLRYQGTKCESEFA